MFLFNRSNKKTPFQGSLHSAARRRRGFTLIELLVVLVILVLTASIVGPRVLDQLDKAKVDTTKLQIHEIEQALDLFKLDVGRYPTEAEGLKALTSPAPSAAGWHGPYLKREVDTDPWGTPYQYKFPGRNNAPDIFSFGQDAKAGGEGYAADVYN